jgi:hypothetical protein
MTEGPMAPDDRPPGDADRPPNDGRDERLAKLLEVPPLDDVTRRRLVRRALDDPGSAPARRRRLARPVAVAAATLVVVVGAAIVLRDGGGNGDSTAARRTGEDSAEDAGERGTNEPAAPTSFGELGEVSDPAVLRERVALAVASEPPAESEDAGTEEPDAAEAAVPPECLTALEQSGAGTPTLVATGTYQAAPALVVVAPRDGTETAFVLDSATCELRSEVPLV